MGHELKGIEKYKCKHCGEPLANMEYTVTEKETLFGLYGDPMSCKRFDFHCKCGLVNTCRWLNTIDDMSDELYYLKEV